MLIIILFIWIIGGYIIKGKNYIYVFCHKFNYVMMIKVPLYPWSSKEGCVYELITNIFNGYSVWNNILRRKIIVNCSVVFEKVMNK